MENRHMMLLLEDFIKKITNEINERSFKNEL